MAGSSGDCLEADLAENQLTEIEEARAFAQAIIDTVREPILVLNQDLRVITASRSFYRTFKVGPEDTEGRLLYELGDGHWDIPKLRLLLEKIVPENGVMEDYEVEYEFPNVGPRTMCLNARKVFYEKGSHTTILLGIGMSPGSASWSAKRTTYCDRRTYCLRKFSTVSLIASKLLQA